MFRSSRRAVFDQPTLPGFFLDLKSGCIDAENDCDVLTVPHNSNLSAGTYFNSDLVTDEPYDAEFAVLRQEMEPVLEIMQHKGDSECALGTITSDEYCGFEKLPWTNLATSFLGGPDLTLFNEAVPSSFVRFALGDGLKLDGSIGVNPFKYGFIAATDTHISAPGLVSEENFPGHGGAGQPNTDWPIPGMSDVLYFGPGGLAGVWSEENSREGSSRRCALRETFATSGREWKCDFRRMEFADMLCDDVDRCSGRLRRWCSHGWEI